MRGEGPHDFDCFLAASLATSLLDDMAAGNLSRWAPIIQNGIALSNEYTLEREETTLLKAWSAILNGSPTR